MMNIPCKWSGWLHRRGGWLLLGCLLSALGCVAWASTRVQFSADRSSLLASDHPAQVAFRRYRSAFGVVPEVVVLVHSDDRELRDSAAARLADTLKRGPFSGVMAEATLPLLPQQGLFFLPPERLQELAGQLRNQRQVSSWMRPGGDPRVLRCLRNCLEGGGRNPYQSPFGPPPPVLSEHFPLLLDGSTRLVVARPQADTAAAHQALETALREVGHSHPGVRLLPVGDWTIQRDDAQATLRGAGGATLLAIVLTHLFFRLAFGRAAPPRRALLALLVALGWSCGWLALVCPRLNLVTVNFAAALVGLGMDFCLTFLFRWEEERERTPLDSQAALAAALSHSGHENLLGALATATAFFSLLGTGFQSIGELGLISGGGVLCCWLASVTVLPALLCWPRPLALGVAGAAHQRWKWLAEWETGWRNRPRPLVLAGVAVTAVLLLLGRQAPRFEGNLLLMLPRNSAAARADEAFHQWSHGCSLFLVSLAPSEAEARARAEQLRLLPGVARVESPLLALPAVSSRQQALVERVVREAQLAPPLPPVPPEADGPTLLRLQRTLGAGSQPLTQGLSPGAIQAGLSQFNRELHADLEQRLAWLKRQRARPAPDLSQLAPELRARARGSDGSWLLKIYPKDDIWRPEALQRFLQEVQRVDPQVTGLPVLTDLFLSSLQNSYLAAGRNALLAIFCLLCLAFRSLRLAGLALFPKLLAMLWTVSLMSCLGMPFNAVNAVSIPLTLGIGLVFSVHVLHRWLLHPQEPLFAGSTGAAVAASGLSTLIGYAALLTVSHRGMASLGVVMSLGLICNLVAALVVFPAVLRWRRGG